MWCHDRHFPRDQLYVACQRAVTRDPGLYRSKLRIVDEADGSFECRPCPEDGRPQFWLPRLELLALWAICPKRNMHELRMDLQHLAGHRLEVLIPRDGFALTVRIKGTSEIYGISERYRGSFRILQTKVGLKRKDQNIAFQA